MSDRMPVSSPVLDVLRLALVGYVVLILIALLYWVFSTQTFAVVRDAATGGAFVAFGLTAPIYVLLAVAAAAFRRRAAARSRSPAHEEVPAPDEQVPPQPQPEPEEQ